MPNKEQYNKLSFNKLLAIVILVGFIAGGLSGGVVGLVAGSVGNFDYLSQNLRDNFSWLLKPRVNPVQDNNNKAEPAQGKLSILEQESATIAAVEKAAPSVVSITVTKELQVRSSRGPFSFPFEDFFDFPFQFEQPDIRSEKRQVGGGTGFVIDQEEGLILTNRHVVEDLEAEYSVYTNDGQEYKAEVLARDPFNDLAVVKVAGLNNLPEVTLGNSADLKLGQFVIAIGNSLGEYRNTVTTGVISGIGRDIVAGGVGSAERLEGVIQTDAAINPGNSGGPLINLSGEVIGINTAISNQGQLIGFAIPIDSAKKVVKSVKEHGKIVRPYLGVRYMIVNEIIAKENNLPNDYGALIVRGEERSDLAVIPGSPADKAGLVENDIVLEVDEVKVDQKKSLSYLIQKYSPGDIIKLKIWHKGETKDIEVVLEEYQE